MHKKSIIGAAFADIEEAFNNVTFSAIETALKDSGLPASLIRWISFMLRNRTLVTDLYGVSVTAESQGGCPQGGVLSPLIWN